MVQPFLENYFENYEKIICVILMTAVLEKYFIEFNEDFEQFSDVVPDDTDASNEFKHDKINFA